MSSNDDLVSSQTKIQSHIKTKVYLVEPKDLDYQQKFLLRVVAT
jgi:hypothetical protein